MTIKTFSLFFWTLMIGLYALFVGVLAWRWWHHDRGAEGQFTAAIILMWFYVVFKLIRERGAWLLFPPRLALTWLFSIPAAPFCLWILALLKTWQCLRVICRPVTKEELRIWR